MGSWIICRCKNQLHMNLYAGASVYVVVKDEIIDSIPSEFSIFDAMLRITREGDLLVKCRNCGRIAIEDHKTHEVRFFSPEE